MSSLLNIILCRLWTIVRLWCWKPSKMMVAQAMMM